MSKKLLYILLVVPVLFFSCTDENNNPPEVFSGKDYFPLSTGHTLIYKVTEITIDKPSDLYDTVTYYLKEVVDIKILDNENDTAYRVERYKRYSESSNWVISDVWESKLSDNTAERVEENHRFVKLRFPVKQDLTWNGNLFNENESQDYWISALNETYTTEAFSFDSCLTVLQDSSSSLIHKDFACEIYALHKGLIYKEKTYLNSQEVIFEVPIEERVTTGTIYIQELIGVEGY
jgi:hypothetical protein